MSGVNGRGELREPPAIRGTYGTLQKTPTECREAQKDMEEAGDVICTGTEEQDEAMGSDESQRQK